MELLIFWVIMAVIVGMIASSKGRNPVAWGFYGLLIWPIALVHIVLSKAEIVDAPMRASPPMASQHVEPPRPAPMASASPVAQGVIVGHRMKHGVKVVRVVAAGRETVIVEMDGVEFSVKAADLAPLASQWSPGAVLMHGGNRVVFVGAEGENCRVRMGASEFVVPMSALRDV